MNWDLSVNAVWQNGIILSFLCAADGIKTTKSPEVIWAVANAAKTIHSFGGTEAFFAAFGVEWLTRHAVFFTPGTTNRRRTDGRGGLLSSGHIENQMVTLRILSKLVDRNLGKVARFIFSAVGDNVTQIEVRCKNTLHVLSPRGTVHGGMIN